MEKAKLELIEKLSKIIYNKVKYESFLSFRNTKQLNKIKLLSAEQAIKIAAGEVVERPVNIIKEIVENSIDAGATKISIFIGESGKKLIKIIDNGCGMTPHDAKLSVATHATSKITTVEDLQTITTFGFRGEALAAINSVSNLAITTKTERAQTGTRVAWNFGKLQEESLQSHATGTTLEIANLFDNIPARQKFLKKDETEWRAITTLFQAFCLDYCSIHFQLYHEDTIKFNCPATTNLTDRAAQLFDNTLQSKILNLVHLENKLCSVTGIISNPTYYRYDRNQIFIFVNQRWVKNIDLTKAIMRGYAGTLPAQKYPAAIIFINIDPEQVDVNIHPKKEEIKFLHPKKIESILVNSIKATLESDFALPSYSLRVLADPDFAQGFVGHGKRASTDKSSDMFTQQHIQPAVASNPAFQQESQQIFHQEPQQSFHTVSKPFSFLHNLQPLSHSLLQSNDIIIPDIAMHAFQDHRSLKKIELAPESAQIQLIQDNLEIVIIGQYKKTYILFEKDNNLIFVDQHAAHERILYEQFKTNFHNVATIQLMFPEFIKLQAQDIIAITPYLALLKEHGIDAQIFSDTQLVIQATPVHLKNQLLHETIQQIIAWITQTDESDPARITNLLHEKIHTKMACSAAIKGGDSLNMQQMQQLLQDLSNIEHRFSCPHGRPTFWVLPIDYTEKQFKRNYEKKAEQFYDFL